MMTSQPMSYPCYEDRHHQCRKGTCSCECHDAANEALARAAEQPALDFTKAAAAFDTFKQRVDAAYGQRIQMTRLDEHGQPISGSTHDMPGVLDFEMSRGEPLTASGGWCRPADLSPIAGDDRRLSEVRGEALRRFTMNMQIAEPDSALIELMTGHPIDRVEQVQDEVIIHLGGNDSLDPKPKRGGWARIKRLLGIKSPGAELASGNWKEKHDG